MKTILVHGLGQNSKDWDAVRNKLEERGISSAALDLFSLAEGMKLSYTALYQAFSEVCGSCEERLNLCGLSLGGLLALNYAKDCISEYGRKQERLYLSKQIHGES